MRPRSLPHLWFCLGFILSASLSAAYAAGQPALAPVGSARVIVADVSAEAEQAKRHLLVEDEVRFQELIATAARSAAAFALIDGTELAMGENAQVRLDEFVLSGGPEASLSLRLGLGALRFVTGGMPKPAYRINTPTASLTVRGTTFNLAVGADGAAYLAVESGAVTVATASGQSVDVAAGQSLSVNAAGIADLPRPTALAPVGALPGLIANMDLALAEHIAGLDPADLQDLSVLDPSRTLARDLGARDLRDRHGLNGGRDRPDRDMGGRGDKGGKGKK
jgi:hypothetical protein